MAIVVLHDPLASALDGMASVWCHDLGQKALSLGEAVSKPALMELSSPYVVWHVIEMLKMLKDVHCAVSQLAHETAA